MTKEGDLRVWYTGNPGCDDMDYTDVKDHHEAIALIKKLSAKDLLPGSSVTDNAMGLEVYEDFGEGLQWTEWYCQDEDDAAVGEDICGYEEIHDELDKAEESA